MCFIVITLLFTLILGLSGCFREPEVKPDTRPTVTLSYTTGDGGDELLIEASEPITFNNSIFYIYDNPNSKYKIEIVGEMTDLEELEQIAFGKNVTEIHNNAFNETLSSLKAVEFSADVRKIGSCVFGGAEPGEIRFLGDAPEVAEDAFSDSFTEKIKVYPTEDAVGFKGITLGGARIEREWIENSTLDASELNMADYAKESAAEAEELLFKITALYEEKKQEEWARIPFTTDMAKYAAVKEFTLGLTEGLVTDGERIAAIYDWICENVAYDEEALRADPYLVLTGKKAVCSGYVTLMHDMLSAVGITSYYVRGIALDSIEGREVSELYTDQGSFTMHAWLAVPVGDGFLYYDPTYGAKLGRSYYAMTAQAIGEHGISLEVDALQVMVGDSDFTDYLFDDFYVQFLYEDGYIYSSYLGEPLIAESSTDYTNGWMTTGFLHNIDNRYLHSEDIPRNSAYNCGILLSADKSEECIYARADGKSFRLSDIAKYVHLENEIFNTGLSLPEGEVLISGDYLLRRTEGGLIALAYLGSEREVTVPAEIGGERVISCADGLFRGEDQLTRVEFSEGIEEIHASFADCPILEEIDIPSTVKYIVTSGNESSISFSHCYNLKAINVDDESATLRSLDGVLYTKGLDVLLIYPPKRGAESFTLSDATKHIAGGAFMYSDIEEISLHDKLYSIGEYAFSYSRLKSVTIPGTAVLGVGAFMYASYLESVTIEPGQQSVGYAAFAECSSLYKVVIPETVQVIDTRAFYGCDSLVRMRIPEGVTSLGSYAFAHSALCSVTLPATLRIVDDTAFYGCRKLIDVNNFSGFMLTPGDDSVGYVAKYATDIDDKEIKVDIIITDDGLVFYVGDGGSLGYCLLDIIYKTDRLILPESINGESYFISPLAFDGDATITGQDYNAFEYIELTYELGAPMKDVREVYIPKSITEIPNGAFRGLVSLERVLYEGTAEDWALVTIDNKAGRNDCILNAEIVFEATP